jgi:hypothetical protein
MAEIGNSNGAASRLRFGPDVLNLPRYEPNVMGRLGDEVYKRLVKPHLTDADRGKYVAIDVEGRGWEIDEDERAAVNRLGEKVPDAQIWLRLVGYRATGVVGGGRSDLETEDL